MASNIQILTDIPTFTPVYNRMEVYVNEADGPTKALTDHQYIMDVYISGVSGYKRFQVPHDPVLGYGVCDIGPYCESYVNWTLAAYNGTAPFSLGATATGDVSIIEVTIKYGYSYSLAGVYTVVADALVGSAKYAFQGALTEQALMGWTYNTYICNVANGANGKFLTDYGRTAAAPNKVSLSNLGWHHILSDTPTDIDSLVIVTKDSTGATIATNIKANTASQVAVTSKMYKVTTGPKALNNMTGGWVSGGPNPIITSSVATYEIFLVNGAGTVASETLYFKIEEPCRYTQRRIYFGNRFGSFDAYNFNLRSQQEQEISRTSYKKNKYPIVTAGANRLYQDESQVVNFVETQEFLTVRSEYLTTAQNDWLKQLVQSPAIYLEIVDHTGVANYLAYEMVSNSSWIEKETSIDKLWILELKLKLSHSNSMQRR